MTLPISGRVRHGARLLRGIWLLLASPYAVLGLVTFVRDNFLSPELRATWDTVKVLPHWPVSWWIVIGLVIILIGVLEGSFQEDRKLRAEPAARAIASVGGDAGVVGDLARGWMDLAREGLSRSQALEQQTRDAEQAKALLATELALARASAANLSTSVTELLASNQELSQLVESNVAHARDVSVMRNQAEERYAAALHTVGNMYLRLAENQPELTTTEDRVGRAVVYAQRFFEAVAFYLGRPMPPPGRSDGEAEERFRAILPVESLKQPSAADTEAPPSTENS